MKNHFLSLSAALAALMLTFASCSGSGDKDNTLTTLAGYLDWLKTNAQSNTQYTFNVSADETIAPSTLYYEDKSNVALTLIATDTERTISLSENATMFTVGSGVTLTLGNNVTLKGRIRPYELVQVNRGGTLVMEMRSRVIDNIYGRGVAVNGSFTMNGGEISGNDRGVTVGNGTFTMNGGEISGNGGGVTVSNGTFTMNGGEISGNIVLPGNTDGGGVTVTNNSTFTMNDGEISGNVAFNGGGVTIARDSTLTMNGGEISGNVASNGGGVYFDYARCTFTMNSGKISGNLASSVVGRGEGFGGGVGFDLYASDSTFTMNGGEISNNTAMDGGGVGLGSNKSFTMNGGEISNNTAMVEGGGVYSAGTFRIVNGTIYGSNETTASLRNSANSSGAALHSSSTGAQYGTFNGIIWNSNGNLSTSNNTIRVVNGVLQ
jgi:hypothetical protein